MERTNRYNPLSPAQGTPPAAPLTTPAASTATPPSRVLMPLDNPQPRNPAMVVLVMGEPTLDGMRLLHGLRQQALAWNCGFGALEVNDEQLLTCALLIENTPPCALLMALRGQARQPLDLSQEGFDLYRHFMRMRNVVMPWGEAPLEATDERLVATDPTPFVIAQRLRLVRLLAFQPPIHPDVVLWTEGMAPERTASTVAAAPLQALDDWLDLPAHLKALPALQALDTSSNASDLAAWIAKLQQGDPAGQGPVAGLVREAVYALAADPAFGSTLTHLAIDATSSCDDRVSLRVHALQTALLVHQAHQPGLGWEQVERLGRQAFLRHGIDRIAAARVDEINAGLEPGDPRWHSEEIETHLAYVHGLFDRLDLGGTRPAALFIQEHRSRVGAQHIDLAFDRIVEDERTQFDDFLALWTPWQAWLERSMPDEVNALKRSLGSPEFADRIQAQAAADLQSVGMNHSTHPNEHSRHIAQLSQAAALKAWGNLTQRLRNRPPE